MNKSDQIRNMFPTQFHSMLSALNQIENNLQEIRIRVNCPCIFVIGRMEYQDMMYYNYIFIPLWKFITNSKISSVYCNSNRILARNVQ